MASERNKLKRALEQYVSDTYADIDTIQLFIRRSDHWIQDREAEVQALRETGDSEKKLGAVLEKILRGLSDLQPFLDAVGRLAVTSVRVFQNELFSGADLPTLCSLLNAARILSPLLLLFKLDNKKFFSPNVLNKDVFQMRLQHYIAEVRIMCDGWKRSDLNNFSSNRPQVNLSDVSEEAIGHMLLQIGELDVLRKHQNFRMVFLFMGRSQSFRDKFCKVTPSLRQLMEELKGCAQQLDSMNHGARISGVVGSSVGIVGGVLSIVGLIAAPFTAGASLMLSAAGAGLGVTSGVQGIVTTSTELGVNATQTNRAKEAFDKCVKLMNELQDFLNDVIQQHFERLQENVLIDVIEATYSGAVFAGGVSGLGSIVYKQLKGGRMAAGAAYDVGEGALAVASVGTRAARVAKCVRIGSGVLNGVFAGVDVFFLARDSIILSKGTETEDSKWIRARAFLFKSEIDSWQKVHDSLIEGEKVYDKYIALLKKPFCTTLN